MKDKEKTPDRVDKEVNGAEDEESLPVIRGDTIGDTAYSQRFVLNILLELATKSSFSEDFIEKELCPLWDMTVEKDVAEFLAGFDGLKIFHQSLKNTEDGRLTEILIGSLANMCCHAEIINKIKQEPDVLNDIISHIDSDDPLIIVQVLRLIYSGVYNDNENLNFWLKCLDDNNFPASITFIMENSMNQNLLVQTFETLNCVFSAYDSKSCDSLLVLKMFVTKKFIKCILTAYQELDRSVINNPIHEIEDGRYQILFLSINSILTCFDSHSIEAYSDENENLFKSICEIMKKAIASMNDSITDIVEYTTAVSSALGFPLNGETEEIFNNMMQLWTRICEKETAIKSDFERFDETDNSIITKVLIQYIVRVLKLWPLPKVKLLFENIQKDHLKILLANTKEMINNECINSYYTDVCSVIENLYETKST